jgi:RsiW-degrading membrane proteinase PrsW (M82 family)
MQLFVPGIILVYQGIRASIGARTGAFRPPWGIAVVTVFAAVVIVGQANMRLEEPAAWPMPALHTLAAVLPGVAYIAFAMRGSWLGGRAVSGISWRQVTLAWGLAIAVGAMSAGFVNTIGGFGVTVLLLVHSEAFEGVSSISGGAFEYDVWDVIGDANLILTSSEQWFANIIAIAVIPPLGEEFLKGLSVLFLMRGTTTRGQAFALGAAAGAGFGFVEALLYGAGVVADDLSAWWQIMLIRAGSTSLHCLATGLVGLGWWYWRKGGRKGRAIVLYFSAVILHAIWNGFAVTLNSEIFWVGTLEDSTIEYVAYGFVIVMAALFVAAIPLLGRALRETPPPPVGETPLGAMRPWLAY